ncbi:uncharacterized protein C8Q71DRAFT_856279 [Rhodofomes roseus]|uniref:Uncharacterized protein n=1 Tax=Rhodofomes roseus TaxID=34475 RepID=A0ABQ8KJL2_9APHY|nr:uncharacterized protein C8Q71DRAFT_856279 [Rhodofomes roseus]KAH9838314.1 hypothetical protein C8Q71DRAFT_856279 [Rhodofomes roseus]
MFARFANPHALDAKIEIVSRNTITEDDTESTGEALRDDGLLSELDRLVKRSLGELDVPGSVEEKSRKKRRKIEKDSTKNCQEGSAESMASIPFRLVSRTLPPKEIELRPAGPPVIVVKEPSCEDNNEEAECRRARAQEAAIDLGQIMSMQSRKLDDSHRTNGRGAIHVTCELPSPSSPVIVVEQSKPTPQRPKIVNSKPSLEIRPSPHTLRPNIHVPVVAVTAVPEDSKSKSSRNIRRARAKAHTTPPRPPATFWRPLREWGVKAAGYSVGYEGSWPVYENDQSRYKYQRDTMRKGVHATEWR